MGVLDDLHQSSLGASKCLPKKEHKRVSCHNNLKTVYLTIGNAKCTEIKPKITFTYSSTHHLKSKALSINRTLRYRSWAWEPITPSLYLMFLPSLMDDSSSQPNIKVYLRMEPATPKKK